MGEGATEGKRKEIGNIRRMFSEGEVINSDF